VFVFFEDWQIAEEQEQRINKRVKWEVKIYK